MSMATLQFYKNPYVYPNYGSITAVGSSMQCTPVGTGLKTGSIKVAGDMADFMNCNYLRLVRNGSTIYAWIEDVAFSTANSYTITYRVDPWRTYRSKVTLGTQFIERSNTATTKQDDLLGSTIDTPQITTIPFTASNWRTLIVQTRTQDGSRVGYSSTPVQPSPYTFWACSYDPSNWQNSAPIVSLVALLSEEAQTNVVTMYSIPYMNATSMANEPLRISWGQGGQDEQEQIPGWRLIPHKDNVHEALTQRILIPTNQLDMTALRKVPHSVKLVVPDAGIIDIPDELLLANELYLRQDVDLFSGASNYMLEDGAGNNYIQSIRGSSVSSIPVLSDAMDTYLSQNQNALTTSLIGDVAMLGVGLGMSATGGGALAGLPMTASAIQGMYSRGASINDMSANNNIGNPPAFLGTALNGAYHGKFWLQVTQKRVANATQVNSNYGYPMNMVRSLTFPSSGYIKTAGCSVTSDGTVPLWAINEINSMFDNGLIVN